MHIDVNKLLHTPDSKQEFSFEMDLSDLEFNGEKLITKPVIVEGKLRNEAGVLHCHLRASSLLDLQCDRCLKPFKKDKQVTYDCVLVNERQFEDDEEIILIENDEVNLDEIATSAFILDMDTKNLCSEDCKGICPGCGVNLNFGKCTCKKEVDPRLAKLAVLLNNDN